MLLLLLPLVLLRGTPRAPLLRLLLGELPLGGLLVGLLPLLMVGDADTPAALFYASSLLLGIGSGSLSPVVVAAIQNAVEERYLGVASSLPGFARAVAQRRRRRGDHHHKAARGPPEEEEEEGEE